MSARTALEVSLARAARSGDAAFESTLDEVLGRARTQAEPGPELLAQVAERLRGELGAPSEGGEGTAARGERANGAAGADDQEDLAASAGPRALEGPTPSGAPPAPSGSAPGSGVRPRGHGWGGLGLLVTGVLIGFVWGRAPAWRGAPDPTPPATAARASGVHPSAPAEVAAGQRREAPSPASAPEAAPSPAQAPRAATSPAAAPGAAQRMPTPGSARGAGSPAPRRAAATAARSARRADGPPGSEPARRQSADVLAIALAELRKAQLFLRAGEPARALDALDALDARVPSAVLRDEREVTRALGFCDSGQLARAGDLAARVLARSPDSPYALSLRESCAGRGELLEQMRGRTSKPAP